MATADTRSNRRGARSVASRATTANANSKKPLLEQAFKDEAEKHQKFSNLVYIKGIKGFCGLCSVY